MQHPTLYKRGAAANVMLQWSVWTDGDMLYTMHGQVGGRLTTSPGNQKRPKNVGHSNATTGAQQAEAEAKAAWVKRLQRGGYRSTEAEARTYLHSVPMLAHKYPERLEAGKIDFPVYVQPKLDGLRVLAYRKDGKVVLQSRKLTFYTAPAHIIQGLAYHILPDSDAVLDGELYCHGLSLGEINSYAKKAHGMDTLRLQFHVYDVTRLSEQGQRQDARTTALNDHFAQCPAGDYIKHVPTFVAENDGDVQRINAQSVAEGFEGSIIRTIDHPYEFDTRSHGLLKLKDFMEEEFEIIDVARGSGKAENWPVFTCANPKGTREKTFSVLPKGTDSVKRRMLDKGVELIGKKLTVRFHNWTGHMQPEHPRGITIREDI